MTFKSLNFSLELVLLFNKLGVNVLEVVNLPLESLNLILSHLKSDSAIILNVAKFLSSKEFLIIQLGQLVLALHVLVIELLEVLNLSIQFLEGSFSLVKLMSFLTNLNMNSSEVLIFLLTGLSQGSNSALAVLKVTLKLLNL
jgi:hypothetical protein